MQPLSAELLAAQRSASAQPVVRVRALDLDAGVPRLRWQLRYAADPAPAPGPVAAAIAGAPPQAGWALLRARITVASGLLEVQRVVEPTEQSDYGTWSPLGTVDAGAGVALGANGDHALLVTAQPGGTAIQVHASADGGAAWGAPQVAFTAAQAASAVAVAVQADGSAFVAAAVGGAVHFVTRSGTGAWSAPEVWTHALATITGLAAILENDYALVVSGTDATGVSGVWTTVYGIGVAAPPGVWLALQALVTASVGTQVSYGAPSVAVAGVARVAFVETHQGATVADRVHLATAVQGTWIASARWREPRPLPVADAYGVALAAGGTEAWHSGAGQLWHAAPSYALLDLSDAVVGIDLRRALDGGALRVEFDRERLSAIVAADAPGQSPETAPRLAPGAELWVEAGYVTTAGTQFGPLTAWQIRRRRGSRREGRESLALEAVDGWGVLDGWRAARLRTWDGTQTGLAVLSELVELTGLRLEVGQHSGELDAITPRVVLRPGDRGATAIGGMLRRIPDMVVMRGLLVSVALVDPDAPADYAYGVEHPLLDIEAEETVPDVGWSRAFGASTFAEAVDGGALDRGAAVRVTIDGDLLQQARADARADTALARDRRRRPRGRLVVRANVGQEPGDLVEVTDALFANPATRLRVSEVRLVYAPARGRFETALSLVEV